MKNVVINGVSKGTLEILERRIQNKEIVDLIKNNEITAVGLCQGDIVSMLEASDIAEKSSEIKVCEVVGMCPQHFICIGIFGDITSVEASIAAIESRVNKK
jgi:acetylglutamate kinase